MDCREELEFHDDSARVAERAKESVLLMKKKMLRSHDLILQYNNKLKECDRLKGDLCTAQEEAAKLKKEHSLTQTKVTKLESQIMDYKKNEFDLEQKIAAQEIRIASDKSHMEQLICKLEGIESKHSGMLMEADLRKSSLEVRIKQLEQELKKLKKSQRTELENSESCKVPRNGKKSLAKGQTTDKETVDVGINTTEQYGAKNPAKPIAAEKSVLTDEFYHTKDNPYPIFCDRCEALTVPSIEKFCRIMTSHPPLLSELSSPPHPQQSSETIIVTDIGGSAESLARIGGQNHVSRTLDTVSPEIENLKQKIATLERKMRKRNKLVSRDKQHGGTNCCGHANQANYCSSRGSSHAMPPMMGNAEANFMSEFWKHMMKFTTESSPRFNENRPHDKSSKKIKLDKRRGKVSMKIRRSKLSDSTNWEVESDDCANQENNIARSKSHILRIKPSKDYDEESTVGSSDQAARVSESSCENSKIRDRWKSNVSLDSEQSVTERFDRKKDRTKMTERRSSSRIHERSLRSRDEKVNVSSISVDDSGRSDSCSPNYVVSAESDRIFRNEFDLNDKKALIDTSEGVIGESRSFRSEEDLSDTREAEINSDEGEHSVSIESLGNRENSRKRKRPISPLKATTRSVKSKLLGKLRTLKKNSNALAAKAPVHVNAVDHSKRSLSQSSQMSNESENECAEDTRNDEPPISIAAKRQRIAHVPKKSLSKERDDMYPNVIEKPIFLPPNKLQNGTDASIKKSSHNLSGTSSSLKSQEMQCPSFENTLGESSNPNGKILEDDDIFEAEESLSHTDEKNALKTNSVDSPEAVKENNVVIQKILPSFEEPPTETKCPEAGDSRIVTEIAASASTYGGMNAEHCEANAENSTLIDESPASPEASQSSHLSDYCADTTISTVKDERATIYETAFLPASTSLKESSVSHPAFVQRNLIKYDTSLFGESGDSSEESEAMNPQSKFSVDNGEATGSSESKNIIKMQDIVKDLRTRQVRCSPIKFASDLAGQQQLPKEDDHEDGARIDAASYQRGIRSLGTLLTRHIGEVKRKSGPRAKKLRRAVAIRLQTEAEKMVRNELEKLIESEEWSNTLHNDVTMRICQVPSRRTVAKAVVDFLVERADMGEPLDRTHTPPAPVMTRTQQRIAALINSLERDPGMSGVFALVRAGIDFNLFRLGYAIQLEVVEFLVRMLTAMARMRKDRESVRILCCNSLYFLGRFASNAIYIVLSIWPEVFPMHGSRLDELANCMVHLLRLDQGIKATSVKRLLKDYYKYPDVQMQSADLMNTTLKTLTMEYTGELEASILLIAKREGTEWAYKHVVNGGLLKLTEDDNYPSLLEALTLLGFVLRTFPAEDESKILATMVDKLCTMLKTTEGSPDKEEGIVSALLSLSRYSAFFSQIADTILTWKPSRAMCTGTIEQLNSFFKFRSVDWWNKRKADTNCANEKGKEWTAGNKAEEFFAERESRRYSASTRCTRVYPCVR